MPHFLFLFVTAGRGDVCYYDQNIHLVKKTIKDLTFNGAWGYATFFPFFFNDNGKERKCHYDEYIVFTILH